MIAYIKYRIGQMYHNKKVGYRTELKKKKKY